MAPLWPAKILVSSASEWGTHNLRHMHGHWWTKHTFDNIAVYLRQTHKRQIAIVSYGSSGTSIWYTNIHTPTCDARIVCVCVCVSSAAQSSTMRYKFLPKTNAHESYSTYVVPFRHVLGAHLLSNRSFQLVPIPMDGWVGGSRCICSAVGRIEIHTMFDDCVALSVSYVSLSLCMYLLHVLSLHQFAYDSYGSWRIDGWERPNAS